MQSCCGPSNLVNCRGYRGAARLSSAPLLESEPPIPTRLASSRPLSSISLPTHPLQRIPVSERASVTLGGLKENLDTAALRMPYCEIFLLQVTAERLQQPRREEEGGGKGGGKVIPTLGSACWVPRTGERSAPGKIQSTIRTLLWVGFPPTGLGRRTPQTY